MLSHFNFKLKREVTIIVPGEIFVSSKNVISTILGSCIAVVLYDNVKKIIGMNHYVLVKSDSPVVAIQRGRYAVYAIPMLIEEMLKQGAEKSRLKAKLFGGANFIPNRSMRVGEENAAFAVSELKKHNIPVLITDFAQMKSRKIFAFPENFEVFVEYPDGAKVY